MRDTVRRRDYERTANLPANGQRRDDCRLSFDEPKVAPHVRVQVGAERANRVGALAEEPVAGRRADRGAVRAVRRVFEADGVLAIFVEGRVAFRESELLSFEEGAVAFASASGVPIVPCAIVGSSELWFRRRVIVRFGQPILTQGLRGASGRAQLESRLRDAMLALLPEVEPRLPRRRPLAWVGELLDGTEDRERHRRHREQTASAR